MHNKKQSDLLSSLTHRCNLSFMRSFSVFRTMTAHKTHSKFVLPDCPLPACIRSYVILVYMLSLTRGLEFLGLTAHCKLYRPTLHSGVWQNDYGL
jgi:hypothetical protein